MTVRTPFHLIVNDVPRDLLQKIVETLDAGSYRCQMPANASIGHPWILSVPMLASDGDDGLPPVTFSDPM